MIAPVPFKDVALQVLQQRRELRIGWVDRRGIVQVDSHMFNKCSGEMNPMRDGRNAVVVYDEKHIPARRRDVRVVGEGGFDLTRGLRDDVEISEELAAIEGMRSHARADDAHPADVADLRRFY